MKILHIIDSGGLYGAEVMLMNLMLAQQSMGLHPVLVSIGTPDCQPKPVEMLAMAKHIPVIPWRMRAGLNIAGAWALFRLARKEGATLLHSHGYKGNILLGLLPWSMRTLPLVTTLHGWTWTGAFNRMLVYEWLDALSLRYIDHVVVVNNTMLQHKRLMQLPLDRRSVIHNGIDFSGSSDHSPLPLPTADQDFISRRFTVVAVGRFSPEKGFSLLIRAVGELVKEGCDLQVLLLGEGRLREELVSLAKTLGIEDRLHMPGHVNDVPRYLKQCQLFAMPSLTEGLPMALLEAMYAQIPIIASRVGGIPEALLEGRAGVLIDPEYPDSLKQSIRRVYEETPQHWAEMVALAKQQVQKTYTSRHMAEEYHRVYLKNIRE